MDTSNENNETNEPDLDSEPFDEQKTTFDQEKGKEERFANNASIHNATLDIEKELNHQEKEDETNNNTNYHHQNMSVESSISQIFGNKTPGQTEMDHFLFNFKYQHNSRTNSSIFERAKWITNYPTSK